MDPVVPVCLLAAALAGFIQGFSGFGSVLLALPVLLTVLEVRTAVPLVSLVALSINVLMVAGLHGHIQRGPMKALLLSSAPGMAIGAWVLDGAPDAFIKGLLGAVILFVVFQALLSRAGAGTGAPVGRVWTVVAGFFSGSIGLLTGANGPPVIAWAARQPWSRNELRATLTCYFLITGCGIVGTQAFQGLVTGDVLMLYGFSLPLLWLGMKIGGAACGKVDEKVFRRVVLALLGLIGATMLWQGFRGVLA